MENYYAARAPEYDAVYLKPERQSDLRAIEQWVAQRFAGASVLEVACGTGYWTQFLAQAAKRVCAFDVSGRDHRNCQAPSLYRKRRVCYRRRLHRPAV